MSGRPVSLAEPFESLAARERQTYPLLSQSTPHFPVAFVAVDQMSLLVSRSGASVMAGMGIRVRENVKDLSEV